MDGIQICLDCNFLQETVYGAFLHGVRAGTWCTNIREGAAGKSEQLPCPGVKFLKIIPSPGAKFSKTIPCP